MIGFLEKDRPLVQIIDKFDHQNVSKDKLTKYLSFMYYVQQGLEIHGLKECGPWRCTVPKTLEIHGFGPKALKIHGF